MISGSRVSERGDKGGLQAGGEGLLGEVGGGVVGGTTNGLYGKGLTGTKGMGCAEAVGVGFGGVVGIPIKRIGAGFDRSGNRRRLLLTNRCSFSVSNSSGGWDRGVDIACVWPKNVNVGILKFGGVCAGMMRSIFRSTPGAS